MSWTITSSDQESLITYESLLRPYIQEADHKNILMFGAASDQGLNITSKVYPSGYEQVFCIGAAKSTGRPDSAAEFQAQYVFPGGESSSIKKAQGLDGESEHAWGSSFSTALASGLTALILDCTEIVGFGEHRDRIRTRDGVDAIFSGMISEKASKYIPVTEFFTPTIANGIWDDDGKQGLKDMMKEILRYWPPYYLWK